MKKIFLILLSLLSLNSLAVTEKEALWSIKVTTWLYKSDLLDLKRTLHSQRNIGKECFMLGKLFEGYQLKKAYSHGYTLRKLNATLGYDIQQILFHYVEKEVKKLKAYCEGDTLGRDQIIKVTNDTIAHLDKVEEIIRDRVKELESE